MRYLVVGAWNTLFGIGIYTVLIHFFGTKHYLIIGIPSNIITITNAYICYKLLVFRTKGNVMREYLRFYGVYGLSTIYGLIMLYIFVDFLGIKPILGNIIVAALISIVSFLGHYFFSFAPKKDSLTTPFVALPSETTTE